MVSSPYKPYYYYLWRMLPRAASSERRCKDAQKRTPRNIDTQHEGMELHRRCPGNVDAEISFRVILFSLTEKRILLSTSISHVSATAVLPPLCAGISCRASLSPLVRSVVFVHVELVVPV